MKRKLRLPHELGKQKGYISQHVERLSPTIEMGRGKVLIEQKALQLNLPELSGI